MEADALHAAATPVSILTPFSEGMQLSVRSEGPTVAVMFQSSPPSRRGCNSVGAGDWSPSATGFNPHPLLGGDATGAGGTLCSYLVGFQSSPPSRRGCNACARSIEVSPSGVSILTPFSEGMQHGCGPDGSAHRWRFNPHPLLGGDATWGSSCAPSSWRGLFQSSPPSRRGCNPGCRGRRTRSMTSCFNPHPLLGGDATCGRRPIQCRQSCGFNPHPLLGGDATLDAVHDEQSNNRFNPHPLLGGDATSRIPTTSSTA